MLRPDTTATAPPAASLSLPSAARVCDLFGQPAMQAIAGAGGTTLAIVITLISLGSAALLALGVMAVAARRQRATR